MSEIDSRLGSHIQRESYEDTGSVESKRCEKSQDPGSLLTP